jgi:hypothetical protein
MAAVNRFLKPHIFLLLPEDRGSGAVRSNAGAVFRTILRDYPGIKNSRKKYDKEHKEPELGHGN